jgi:hypothetical protein
MEKGRGGLPDPRKATKLVRYNFIDSGVSNYYENIKNKKSKYQRPFIKPPKFTLLILTNIYNVRIQELLFPYNKYKNQV